MSPIQTIFLVFHHPRTIEKDLSALSIGLHTAWRRAQDREQWQRTMEAAPSRGPHLKNVHNTFSDWCLANDGPHVWNSLPANCGNGTVQTVAENTSVWGPQHFVTFN